MSISCFILKCFMCLSLLFMLWGCGGTPIREDALELQTWADEHYAEEYYADGSNGEAVLLVHGFDAMPLQMAELAQTAQSMGYTVYAILLPGHCGSTKDLGDMKWEQMAEKVEASYQKLAAEHSRVHCVGFSIGGALCLGLSSQKDVASLTLIAPALHIVSKHLPVKSAVKGLSKIISTTWTVRGGGVLTFNGKEIKVPRRHNVYVPTSAIVEVSEMLDDVGARLGGVKCPLLVMTPKFDIVVNRKSARDIYDGVSSESKRYVELNSRDHVVLLGAARATLNEELKKFLEQQNKPPLPQ